MSSNYIIKNTLLDPVWRASIKNNCTLRSYQAEALRSIYDAAAAGRGGRFAVTFPRQSGKNETQAQLEAALMAANLSKGGHIIKIIPTEKNQGKISTERLAAVLMDGESGINQKKDEISYGSAKLRCLSASPNAAIVGATADILLEVDEAQMVTSEKYDREAAPMAAASNAVQVFWGTAWDDQTLLARESRLAEKDEESDNRKHIFKTTAAEVGKEVPAYGMFVSGQIAQLGREHPAIRTQFFCEEISELTAMFTGERIERMKGAHEPLYSPEPDHCYVFLIDVAGSDETTPSSRRANGFDDRRDATVVTICEVSLPEGKSYDMKNFVWKTSARRLYRNVRIDQLEQYICSDIEHWQPSRVIIDHSGLGAMLSDILINKYKIKILPIDITAANKTRMAWDFLAMVDTGRWLEYKSDEMNTLTSGFKPGRESCEILKDPALLQQMFFRELRGCRMEPSGNGQTVRWGVKDGTRDHVSGRFLHDDLVMSAALAVFDPGTLPLYTRADNDAWIENYLKLRKMIEERDRRELRRKQFFW